MISLCTEEGRNIDTRIPSIEHPNPQFRRDVYASLNGEWDFCIADHDDISSLLFNEKIVVPFAVETALSEVQRSDLKGKYLCYKKQFDLPKPLHKDNVTLHFDAVDCICDVYLNGVKLGHHEGGYESFSFEGLTLHEKGNLLIAVVQDNTDGVFPSGKQSLNPSGIWYQATSGIWGNVWVENVPEKHLESIRYDFIEKGYICRVFAKSNADLEGFSIEVFFKGELVKSARFNKNGVAEISLGDEVHLWDVDSPNLYDVKISNGYDTVFSYFGFRIVSKVEVNGFLYPAINGKPVFLTGPLDQGYFPESGLTPPTDQSMVKDILLMKSYGFNMVRKHIKIEPDRWYYHCDRLGILVMQDFVNIGAPYSTYLVMTGPFIKRTWNDQLESIQAKLHSSSKQAQAHFLSSMESTTKRLMNHPSIIAWTIFNEGWGQFDTKNTLDKLTQIDSSRLVDANSGWIDQGVGDFCSRHIYFRKAKLKNDHKRILSLSEFGGYSLSIEGHTYSKKTFGYKRFKSQEDLEAAITRLYENEIIPLKKEGLAVAVYTQLSDVETENNGLITYDREVLKVRTEVFSRINQKLKEIN